jgi:hypothetical protein
MKRNARWTRWSLVAVAASTVMLSSAAAAQAYSSPFTFGIAGGASIPLGDFADFASTGWHAGGLVEWNTPTSPVGVRVEGVYHKFGEKDEVYRSVIAGLLNLVWNFPMTQPYTVRPYLIGGAGIYDMRIEGSDSQTKPGLNGGAGITVPLSGFSTFIEARFHIVFDSDTNQSNSTFVPISVGIRFR